MNFAPILWDDGQKFPEHPMLRSGQIKVNEVIIAVISAVIAVIEKNR